MKNTPDITPIPKPVINNPTKQQPQQQATSPTKQESPQKQKQ